MISCDAVIINSILKLHTSWAHATPTFHSNLIRQPQRRTLTPAPNELSSSTSSKISQAQGKKNTINLFLFSFLFFCDAGFNRTTTTKTTTKCFKFSCRLKPQNAVAVVLLLLLRWFFVCYKNMIYIHTLAGSSDSGNQSQQSAVKSPRQVWTQKYLEQIKCCKNKQQQKYREKYQNNTKTTKW